MPLTLSCLVVDDDAHEAKSYCARLNAISAREFAQYKAKGMDHERLIFEPLLSVNAGDAREFYNLFRDRLERVETDASDVTELTAIIFDYRIDLMADANDAELRGLTGITMAKEARRLRPTVSRFLLTAHSLDPATNEDARLFSGLRLKQESQDVRGLTNLFRLVCDAVSRRYRAPFWEGLQDYAKRDKLVFHAMAAADSKGAGFGSVDEFVKFFGPNYFNAEASLTIAPLDSLLAPKASLKLAQELFSSCFGSNFCAFVTNGTSTANKIVHQATTSRGDYLLLDKCCHISHHYAVASIGSRPWYLENSFCKQSMIAASVSPSEVIRTLRYFISGQGTIDPQEVKLPSLISLTNCSFDGIAFNPRSLFTGVAGLLAEFKLSNRLCEIVFLIDEAWFSFARFHPKTTHLSAMSACQELDTDKFYRENLRVYVTQSVHKTLFAFRQASVILAHDPFMDNPAFHAAAQNASGRFASAYLCNTSTSPHAGMLASLDVARRQVDFEGKRLIDIARTAATQFTRALTDPVSETEKIVAAVFGVHTCSSITGALANSELYLDETKVTVFCRYHLPGAKLKELLWNQESIQINKYGPTTGLFMFTPGVGGSTVYELLRRLAELSEAIRYDNSAREPAALQLNFCAEGGGGKREFVDATGNLAIFPHCIQAGSCPDLQHWMFGPGSRKVSSLTITRQGDPDERFISATFVTPYPPGYPVIVPGERFTRKQLFDAIGDLNDEVHGVTRRDRDEARIRAIVT